MNLNDLEKNFRKSTSYQPPSLDSLESNFQATFQPITPMEKLPVPVPEGGITPEFKPIAPMPFMAPPEPIPLMPAHKPPIQPKMEAPTPITEAPKEKTFLQKAIPIVSKAGLIFEPFIQAQLFALTGEEPYREEPGFIKKSLGLEEFEGVKALTEGYKQVAKDVLRGAELLTKKYEEMPDVKKYNLEDPNQRTEYAKALLKARRGGAGTPGGTAVSETFRKLSELDRLQPDQDYYERLNNKKGMVNYLEQVTNMAPQMATQIAAYAVGGTVGSGVWMALQIAGGEYNQLKQENPNIDDRRAATAAYMSALMQAPLESISLGFMLNNPITRKFVMGGILKFGLDRLLGGGTEWITETVQQIPSTFWQEWAKNPNLIEDIKKNPQIAMDLIKKGIAEGIPQGNVAAFYGILLGGAGDVGKPAAQKGPAAGEIVSRETPQIIQDIEKDFKSGNLTKDDLKEMQGELNKDHPLYNELGRILGAEKPAEKAPAEGNRLADFEEVVKKKFKGVEVGPIYEANPEGADNVKTVGKALGLKVVFFKGEGELKRLQGARALTKNTIFINENAREPYLTVLGHESLHSLRHQHKDLYDSFLILAKDLDIGFQEHIDLLNKARKQLKLPEYTLEDAIAKEEFVADFVGQQFTKPEFWERINEENPTLGKQLAQIINELIEKIRTSMRKIKKLDAKYYAQINDVQDALASVYGEFARRETQVKDETATQIVKPKGKIEKEYADFVEGLTDEERKSVLDLIKDKEMKLPEKLDLMKAGIIAFRQKQAPPLEKKYPEPKKAAPKGNIQDRLDAFNLDNTPQDDADIWNEIQADKKTKSNFESVFGQYMIDQEKEAVNYALEQGLPERAVDNFKEDYADAIGVTELTAENAKKTKKAIIDEIIKPYIADQKRAQAKPPEREKPVTREKVTEEDLKISIENNKVPDFTSQEWIDRYYKWAARIQSEYGKKPTELDKQIFKLRNFVEDAYGNYKNPIVVEFDNAYAYGPVDEVMVYRYRGMGGQAKTQWGDTVMLRDPSELEIPEKSAEPGIKQIIYWLKDTSPVRQAQITRNELKGILKKAGINIGPFGSIKALTAKNLKRWVAEGGDYAAPINHLKEVTGLDENGLARAFKNGDAALIERLAKEGKLAPKSKVGGVSKYEGPRITKKQLEAEQAKQAEQRAKLKKLTPELNIPKGRAGAIGYTYQMAYDARKQYPDVEFKNLVAIHVYDDYGDAGRLLAIRYSTRENHDEIFAKTEKEFPGAVLTNNYDLTPYRPRKGEISYKEYSRQRDQGIESPEIKPTEKPAAKAAAPEEIEMPAHKKGYASHNSIRLAQDESGKWSYGMNFHLDNEGFAFPPGSKVKYKYSSRDDALKGAIDAFRSQMQRRIDSEKLTKTATEYTKKLNTFLDEITPIPAKPAELPVTVFENQDGDYVMVDKGPAGNWTFYTKKRTDLKAKGTRVRGKGQKLWYPTEAEAVKALEKYAKKRGWTERPDILSLPTTPKVEVPAKPGTEKKPILGTEAKFPENEFVGGGATKTGLPFKDKATAQRFLNQYEVHPTKEAHILYQRDMVPSGEVTEGYIVALFNKNEGSDFRHFNDVKVKNVEILPGGWEVKIDVKESYKSLLHQNKSLNFDRSEVHQFTDKTWEAQVEDNKHNVFVRVADFKTEAEAENTANALVQGAKTLTVVGLEDYGKPTVKPAIAGTPAKYEIGDYVTPKKGSDLSAKSNTGRITHIQTDSEGRQKVRIEGSGPHWYATDFNRITKSEAEGIKEGIPEKPGTAEPKTEAQFKKRLELAGATRYNGVDYKILKLEETGSYYVQVTEKGIRTKLGGAGMNVWSRNYAIERAAKEAGFVEKPLTLTEKKPTLEAEQKPAGEMSGSELLAEWDKQAAKIEEPTTTEEIKEPTVAEKASQKAQETAAHVKNAIDNLKKINDILGDRGSIGSDVDSKKWEQIRPLLKSAWDEMVAAGKSGAEFVELAIKVLSPKGKPYFEKFVKEEIEKEAPSVGIREATPKISKGEPAPVSPGARAERPAGQLPEERGRPSEGREGQGAEERGAEPRGPGIRERDIVPAKRGRSADARPGRYRISESDDLEGGGQVGKYEKNVAAIKLLKQIESENRKATPEEQAILVKYSGWGGIAQAFDRYNRDWDKRYTDLKELLSEKEYDAAKASTPNAHYTSPDVIKFIYNALEKMGFEGGRILEPAAGTGHFFGMLSDRFASSKLSGVELDDISGRIARQLYQDADIRITGYQDAKFPDNYFDLVVSNVPFANVRPYDRKYKLYRFQLHDYYFAKSLDKVRPGGMVAFVTSKGTMDKKDKLLRKYIADRAELVAAVRLPSDAFKKIANTEVTTDIMFLRKYMPDEKPKAAKWLETKDVDIGEGFEAPVNQYFLDNPEMVQGKWYRDKLVGGVRAGVQSDGRDLAESLGKLVNSKMPDDAFKADTQVHADVEDNLAEMIPAPEDIKQLQFFEKDGKFYQLEEGKTIAVSVPKQHKTRMRGLIGIRDSIRNLFRNQLANKTDQFKTDVADLNKKYDAFVKKYGHINEGQTNKALFSEDPEYARLLALEKKEGDKYIKTSIFTKPSIIRYEPITHAESPEQAYVASMIDKGGVDWDYISGLLNTDQKTAQDKLYGQVFLDPERGWVPSDEYLSGNVREKLEAARAAVETEQDADTKKRFVENVKALEDAQPEDLKPSQISAKLGSNWIPAKYIKTFAKEVAGVRGIDIRYIPETAHWVLEKSKVSYDRYSENPSLANKFRTDRRDFFKILQYTMNNQRPIIKDKIYDPETKKERTVVNKKETLLVEAKIQNLRTEFERWVWNEEERRETLARIYNDTYNNIRLRQYDGSNLPDRLPGMSPLILEKGLRPHQKNAIWRIVQGGNTLLDHKVGSGKTYTMIGAAMEMKRLGMAKKPLFAVPKPIVEQFSRAFQELYPSARILHAELKQDKKQRNKMMARITTGDWDAVIVTHPQFEKLAMSKEAQQKYIEDQIDELEAAIHREMAEDQSQGRRKRSQTVKEIEKAKERLESKLQEILDAPKDDLLTFEELGVDQMFVDEAHNYKNLFFTSKMTRVPGVGANQIVQKTADMELKTNYLTRLNNGRGVVFSTGTPISNSISEMWVMSKYLAQPTLREYGMHNFDAWANTFGELVTEYEIDPTGAGFRQNTRFRKFSNLAELQNLYRLFGDVVLQKDVESYIKIPTHEGGKIKIVDVEPTESQRNYVAHLVERAEAVRSGTVDPREDNMLAITTDGRKSALDGRTVGVGEGNKLPAVAKNVVDIYKSNPEMTQLVFIDISAPKKKEWNAYSQLKEQLIDLGMKKEEVVFIHDAGNSDAKRDAIFEKFRKGEIKVLLGSSAKMGEGVDVPDRVIALHHVDAPWKPAQIEQRNGRAFRQGNVNDTVSEFRYVTKATFDAYMWQILEYKANFIEQVKSFDMGRSTEGDVDSPVLTYGEVKALASENPLVFDLYKNKAELARLEVEYGGWRENYFENQKRMKLYPKNIERIKSDISKFEAAKKIVDANPIAEDAEIEIEIDGKVLNDRKEARGLILGKIKKAFKTEGQEIPVAKYRGIEVVAENNRVKSAFKKGVMLNNVELYYGDLAEAGFYAGITPVKDYVSEETAAVSYLRLITDRIEGDAERSITGKIDVLNQALKNQESEFEKAKEFPDNFDKMDQLEKARLKNEQLIAKIEGKKPEGFEGEVGEEPFYLRLQRPEVEQQRLPGAIENPDGSWFIPEFEAQEITDPKLAQYGTFFYHPVEGGWNITDAATGLGTISRPTKKQALSDLIAHLETEGTFDTVKKARADFEATPWAAAKGLEPSISIPEFAYTQDAIAWGENVAEQDKAATLEKLEALRQDAMKVADQYKEADDFNNAMIWATKGQFYREAAETIQGTINVPKMLQPGEVDKGEKVEFSVKKLSPIAKDYLTALRSAEPNAFIKRSAEDIKVDIYPDDPHVKERMQVAKGLPVPGFMQRLKTGLKETWQSVTRHRPYLDPKEMPDIANVLRIHQEVPENAKRRTFQVLNNILQGLRPKQYEAFSMKLIMDDMVKDIDSGLLTGEGGYPFGFENEQDVRDYLDKITGIAESDPMVNDALRRRNAFNDALKKMLVKNDLLPKSVLDEDAYWHHQVLEYRAIKAMGQTYTGLGVGAKDVRLRRKGWQIARKGSVKDYNTDYAESEFEVISQAISQLETKQTLNRLRAMADITPALKEMAKINGVEDWHDIPIPEGYTTWKPKPNSSWYKAHTLTDRMVEAIAAGEEVLGADNVDEIKTALARGKDVEWIIKEGLAKTLDGYDLKLEDHLLSKASRNAMNAWKKWILINPYRVVKYNLNNMSGDLDIALAYDPMIMKYFTGAIRDLAKKKLSPELQAEIDDAYRLGVIGSGWSVQEISAVNSQLSFDKQLEALTGQRPNLITKGWRALSGFTVYRENLLRLAAFRYFKEKIAAGKTDIYGASNYKEIDGIKDPTERAAKLSRDLIGDYGNITHAGQWIRRHIVPFYAWMEINAPRYVRLIANLKHEGQGAKKVGRIVPLASAKIAWKGTKLGFKAAAMYALVSLWNRTFFPDEEEELGEAQRRQLHLILGRRSDGTIVSLRFQGALSDALSWFGGEDIVKDVEDVIKGKASITDKAKEAALATPIKIINGLRPDVKILSEIVSERQFYPNPFNPRPLRDKLEHIARMFSLDGIYRWLAGKPKRGDNVSKQLLSDLMSLGLYTSDPGESAYYDIISKTFDFKEKVLGTEAPSIVPTNKSNALYFYKQALRYGDLKAAQKYLGKYFELGGTRKGLKISVARAHPLGNLAKKDWNRFVNTLSLEDKQKLALAEKWYNQTYHGQKQLPLPLSKKEPESILKFTLKKAKELIGG